MIEIIFRSEAEADLRSIVDHYEQVAPASVDAILADIHRSISQLAYFPRLGMAVPERAFRRIVMLRYHFKVAYGIEDGRIVILGIFRYQDREA